MVSNFFLRLMWTLTISPGSIGIVMDPTSFAAILAAVEISRRAQWNLFRLENEQINNVGKYRAFNVEGMIQVVVNLNVFQFHLQIKQPLIQTTFRSFKALKCRVLDTTQFLKMPSLNLPELNQIPLCIPRFQGTSSNKCVLLYFYRNISITSFLFESIRMTASSGIRWRKVPPLQLPTRPFSCGIPGEANPAKFYKVTPPAAFSTTGDTRVE
jgi:hypothetical protein